MQPGSENRDYVLGNILFQHQALWGATEFITNSDTLPLSAHPLYRLLGDML